MSNVVITIKNYRCFTENNPVVFNVEKGFTSFVGPNNSGKSALLKFFYEFRHLVKHISMNREQTERYNDKDPLLKFNIQSIGGGLLSVQDFNEIFNNSNNAGITLELALDPKEFKSSELPVLTSIRLEIKRKAPWPCLVYYQWTPRIVDTPREKSRLKFEDGLIKEPSAGTRIIADTSQLFTCLNNLADSVYIGAFRNAINEGGGNYFDIAVGTSFISTWNNWKTGVNKNQNSKIIDVTNDVKNLLGFSSLEINASDDKTTLQVFINNKPYLLREIGAGMAQLIIVLANVAIKNPAYILIDEPELNLHPTLQADFLTSLASYASKGVFFATHSMGLARAHSERVYSVQMREGVHAVRALESTSRYSEFIGEMGFSSYQEMGFEAILFVEGVKDVKTFQQFLRKLGIDHKVVILPLGGDSLTRGGIDQELIEVLRITKTVFAIVDSEREAAGEQPIKNRRDFQKICKKVGIGIHITERRAIENYFSDKAIKEEKGLKYNVLGEYEKLGTSSLSWGKSENWRIARRMEWDELKSTDVGKFLIALMKRLKR